MLLKVENLEKSIGLKELFHELSFRIEEGEKVAIIGRNGLGKTTLFRILNGEDNEYYGTIEMQKGLKLVVTRQEHFLSEEVTPLEYILDDVPKYRQLQQIIKKYEKSPTHEWEVIQEYSDAINDFSQLEYYQIEDKILESLKDFQIDEEMALESMSRLSGGEKRFVELVRVMYSGADIALIDEPTNHMDYVGKAKFIEWLDAIDKTMLIITHDRDVLKHVTRILELKDKKFFSFNGNYDAYTKQNSLGTVTGIEAYELGLKNLDKAKKQMLDARTAKLSAKSNKGRIQAKVREERFQKEMEKLKSELEKPSFWIDKESLEQISDTVVDKYEKYKEKNITIRHKVQSEHKKELMLVKNLSVGYSEPLFSNIFVQLYHGDRLFIKGRNGAGKTTLVRTLINLIIEENSELNQAYIKSHHNDRASNAKIYYGTYKFSQKLKLGIYEQEIDKKYLNLTLSDAVGEVYKELDLPVNQQAINNVLGSYLFNPETDANLTFDKLSGGQKARFQLIKMLASNPNLLILDEPTNHLDLPSIEELENTLLDFPGAIIYISHDNYFINKMGGEVIELSKTDSRS